MVQEGVLYVGVNLCFEKGMSPVVLAALMKHHTNTHTHTHTHTQTHTHKHTHTHTQRSDLISLHFPFLGTNVDENREVRE
jgi:ABC-type nickel/cobalt efflux system permease component RcnA